MNLNIEELEQEIDRYYNQFKTIKYALDRLEDCFNKYNSNIIDTNVETNFKEVFKDMEKTFDTIKSLRCDNIIHYLDFVHHNYQLLEQQLSSAFGVSV